MAFWFFDKQGRLVTGSQEYTCNHQELLNSTSHVEQSDIVTTVGESKADLGIPALKWCLQISDIRQGTANKLLYAEEGVVVDTSGNVYFTNGILDSNYPVTPDAFQKTLKGVQDGLLGELSADFSKFQYATYMGGTTATRYNEAFRAIAIDSKGNIYVAGITESTDWPTLNAFQPSHAGNWDGVLAKFIFTRRPSNH